MSNPSEEGKVRISLSELVGYFDDQIEPLDRSIEALVKMRRLVVDDFRHTLYEGPGRELLENHTDAAFLAVIGLIQAAGSGGLATFLAEKGLSGIQVDIDTEELEVMQQHAEAFALAARVFTSPYLPKGQEVFPELLMGGAAEMDHEKTWYETLLLKLSEAGYTHLSVTEVGKYIVNQNGEIASQPIRQNIRDEAMERAGIFGINKKDIVGGKAYGHGKSVFVTLAEAQTVFSSLLEIDRIQEDAAIYADIIPTDFE